jgi:hypothetical protein
VGVGQECREGIEPAEREEGLLLEGRQRPSSWSGGSGGSGRGTKARTGSPPTVVTS